MSLQAKSDSYQMIKDFMEDDSEGLKDYREDISALWEVTRRCREIAIKYQAALIQEWMIICRELYLLPKDLTGLYQSVLDFINKYNQLKQKEHE